jgi:SanA protein
VAPSGPFRPAEKLSFPGEGGARLFCAAVGLLLLGPTLIVAANLWVFRSARPHMYVDGARVPARGVAIVPGTAIRDGEPGAVLRHRLAGALELYKTGKVKVILVSGNRRDDRYDEAAAMTGWLRRHGVPRADIVEDPAGFRTLDTMQRAALVFGVKEAIVCSQGIHLARAVFLARQSGINAVGLAVDPPRRRGVRMMAMPRETLGSVLAIVDTVLGRRARVLGPPA